jgi:hypothetical protein
MECAPTPFSFVVFTSNSHLNLSTSLGTHHIGFFWEHALANFPTLIHFLSSWVEFRKSKNVPILGPNIEPSSNSLEVRARRGK